MESYWVFYFTNHVTRRNTCVRIRGKEILVFRKCCVHTKWMIPIDLCGQLLWFSSSQSHFKSSSILWHKIFIVNIHVAVKSLFLYGWTKSLAKQKLGNSTKKGRLVKGMDFDLPLLPFVLGWNKFHLCFRWFIKLLAVCC